MEGRLDQLEGKKVIVTWYATGSRGYGATLMTLGDKYDVLQIRDEIESAYGQEISIMSIVEVSQEIFDLNWKAQRLNAKKFGQEV